MAQNSGPPAGTAHGQKCRGQGGDSKGRLQTGCTGAQGIKGKCDSDDLSGASRRKVGAVGVGSKACPTVEESATGMRRSLDRTLLVPSVAEKQLGRHPLSSKRGKSGTNGKVDDSSPVPMRREASCNPHLQGLLGEHRGHVTRTEPLLQPPPDAGPLLAAGRGPVWEPKPAGGLP